MNSGGGLEAVTTHTTSLRNSQLYRVIVPSSAYKGLGMVKPSIIPFDPSRTSNLDIRKKQVSQQNP